MNTNPQSTVPHQIELWGGLECTVNRVMDEYFCQMERNGHVGRKEDLERFASLGIRALRYPVLWEHTAPNGLEQADWSLPDERLPILRDLDIAPIVGLVHHGSGPAHTSLIDPTFAEELAEFAGAVARRYPWLEYYTPVNEPLTTARFAGLYGIWYPHGRDDTIFIQALLNQCRAVVLSMRAIRVINPNAKLLQTDDLGKTYSTPVLAELADFYNERRWLGWDLLCGKVGPAHALWSYLCATGIPKKELLWFQSNPCPPDIIGLNYYVTSERWLDHTTEHYPERYVGTYRDQLYADIEAPRALAVPRPGIGPLLQEAWERYRLPLAVTEVHIDAHREDQLRWLLEIWEASQQAQRNGVDIRAVTVWALLGSYDWNCLVTECKGYYEPGPLDVRSLRPRATAMAAMMRELTTQSPPSHPVLQGAGWWRRPGRFFCPPAAVPEIAGAFPKERMGYQNREFQEVLPILITGATGTLGQAFARLCTTRNLAHQVVTRQEMDFADPASVERAIVRYRPWAIINAGGYVRVDEAEADTQRCFRENALGPSVLAIACARHSIQLMTFSSDLVFDGCKEAPYVESDKVSPLNVYGHSKAEAEQRVLNILPNALVIRTSSFFGPWDNFNFVTQALEALASGAPFVAVNDMTMTPTYVPDLVNVCLDLLIDKEKGIWHLTNAEPITWSGLALRAAQLTGIDASRLEPMSYTRFNYAAPRPLYSALHNERATLLPTLDDALSRYLAQRPHGGVPSPPEPLVHIAQGSP